MRINSISSGNNANLTSNKNVNFKGRYISGNYYEDDVIDFATKVIDENKKVSADELKKGFMDLLEESKTSSVVSKIILSPIHLIVAIVSPENLKDSVDASRIAVNANTLCLAEILNAPEVAIRKLKDNARVTKMLQNINNCTSDLLKERNNKG